MIAIEQGKGGVLKTATAIALAEAAAEAGADVLLADSDPQGSAGRWHQLAEAAGRPLRCTVAGIPSKTLADRLPVMAAAYAMVFIDGPPVRDDLIVAGIQAADLVVMPVPPKKGDIDRVPSLLKAAADAGKPVLAVLTFTRADTRQALAAREALTEMGVAVAETTIPYSMPVADQYGTRPRARLAAYGRDLLAEVLTYLGSTETAS
uniref:AAA family ATPase n=1 Tax=Actinoplanes sp. CA-151224 TaxID=3239904 RepID=UPI003F497EF1